MSNVKSLNREEKQFEYKGRWVNKKHFRAFVYNGQGDQKLAESYEQFEAMIGTGVWFASKVDASPKRKQKDGPLCANG